MAGIFIMEKLEKYKSKLRLIKIEREERDEVILFFSFDVVNSSMYKEINYYGWSKVLDQLFKEVQKRVINGIDNVELWRVLGDEIIFLVRINDEELLFEEVKIIYQILLDSIRELKNGKLFEKLNYFEKRERELMKLQNVLSLQATAWIALVRENADGSEDTDDSENIFVKYTTPKNYQIFEFLGNDIDAGFRISKQTRASKMVLSFELAYILSRRTDELKKINIITYKELKGIWKNHLYPIIWYHDPDCADGKKLEETFLYDECSKNDLVKEYYENRDNETLLRKVICDEEMFNQVDVALQRILDDMNLTNKIKKIQNTIKKADIVNKEYVKPNHLEMHCVAVCYSPNRKAILVAKRKSNREYESGKWEFGCAKAKKDESLCESIKEEYKRDFGIYISPYIDKKRIDREPIPLALYQIDKKDKGLHKGVITLAKVDDDYDIDSFTPTAKHEKVTWIKEEEIDTFEGDKVEDFDNTLHLAFKKIRELEG